MTDQTVSLLQLVKRKDSDNSDINSVDFLSLPTELQYQGWMQGLPQPDMPSVDEAITLLMNAGNANTLATALQSIDTKIKEIGWAQDPLNPIGVWLRAQLSGETGQRQCFILDAKRPPKGLEITSPLAYQGVVQNYNLGLTRMPRWENVLAQQVPASPSAITIHGGKIAYTIGGDAHARVAYLRIPAPGVPTLYDAWFGVKSNRYGVNPTNFVPTWSLDLGTLIGSTSPAADAQCIDGNKVVCSSLSTTWENRIIIPVSAVTANITDQRGKYIVLLRAKVTGTLIGNVRVGNGFLLSSVPVSFSWMPLQQIKNTAGYQYVPLGQVKIPVSSDFELALPNAALALQTQLVSGSGNLEVDCFVLIPAEHSIHASVPTAGFGSSFADLYIRTRPDGRYSAVTYHTSLNTIIEMSPPDAIDWSIPSGSGVIVCCGTNPTTVVGSTFSPVLTVYPSYNSLRGSA